jgi:hypothetical protein
MSEFDPGQREHELSEALVTLIIAVSRYGQDDVTPRPTADRLASLERIAILVAEGVEERIANISGAAAARAFRKELGRAITRGHLHTIIANMLGCTNGERPGG